MEKNIKSKEIYLDGISEPIIFETGWKAKKDKWKHMGKTGG